MRLFLDSIDVVGMMVILIGVGVLSPIMGYALHQFHTLRRARIMKFRNSPLIAAMNGFIFVAVVERAYFCFFTIWQIENPLPDYAEHICIGICIASIYLLVALKTWLLYFEQSYHLSVANAAWKKLINEQAQSWFIRHRRTYGDWRYLLKIGALPSALYMSMCIALGIMADDLQRESISTTIALVATDWMLHALPLLFSVVIYHRFHSKDFKDLYRISYEIKCQCAIVVVYEMLKCAESAFPILRFLELSKGSSESHWLDIVRLEALCNFVLTVSFLFTLSVFTSSYPVYIHLMTEQGNRLSELFSNGRNELPKRRRSGIGDIANIIRHKEGFKALMNHLLIEFSTENLLFITELIQIKYAFQLKNRNILIIPRFSVFESIGSANHGPSNQLTVRRQDGGYLDNDKYAVLDFNAKCVASERSTTPRSKMELSEFGNLITTEYPVATPGTKMSSLSPNSRKSPEQSERSLNVYGAEYDDSKSTEQFNADHDRKHNADDNTPPVLHQQTTIESVVVELSRKLSEAKELTKAVYQRGRVGANGSTSMLITKDGKLPRMHTFLFRDNGSIMLKLELPPGLPPSIALEDVHKKNNLALQYEYLFQKFIRQSAVHEVNLSHGVRTPLCRFFGTERMHLTHGKVESFIFNIFDEAARQILELMCDSFSRFASTRTFRHIQSAIERDDSSVHRSCDGYREESAQSTTPVVRNATSLPDVMNQYAIDSCGGLCFRTENVSA